VTHTLELTALALMVGTIDQIYEAATIRTEISLSTGFMPRCIA
jgi:hypothetical protein